MLATNLKSKKSLFSESRRLNVETPGCLTDISGSIRSVKIIWIIDKCNPALVRVVMTMFR